ncbi:MAG TPA: hypothetical protein VJT67_03005 [Longimicrobiaceae bacterium]|nr:hypothetical protein [Longimicrobiaceae bacterium]
MKDVRDNLSELVKRATYRGEKITFGPNRGDDVTLIATEDVRRMEARLRDAEAQIAALRRESAEPVPFAGLQTALESGAIDLRGAAPRTRRVISTLDVESGISRDDRIAIGARDAREPEFRRTRPRA